MPGQQVLTEAGLTQILSHAGAQYLRNRCPSNLPLERQGWHQNKAQPAAKASTSGEACGCLRSAACGLQGAK